MEEDNDLEQVTGSPTAGENEFVHVESVDSAQTDGTSINQVEHLEQDDGVVVTGVDAAQDEPHEVRTHEDGGQDEFVDCPDDLLSNEAKSPGSAIMPHQQPFRDDTVDIIKRVFDNEKEIIPHDYEEERRVLMKEVSNLHRQLKALSNQHSLVDENIAEGGEKSNLPLLEMVNECSKFVEFSANERLQSEATLNTKDKEIEDLMIRVNDQSKLQDLSSFEVVIDRILSSILITFGGGELPDTSVSEKLSYLEENTSYLLKNYNFFIYEIQTLAQCLVEVKPDFPMENYLETIFPTVAEELVGIKKKELEFNEKYTALEYKHGQLIEQFELLNAEIEKLKGEVEQEKTRYSNTKEKLSMAVTKGKALVQQRDSLKQLVSEKTSELERCLVELQEKSTALEAAELRIGELTQAETLTNSLQVLFQGLPEVAEFPNLEYQLSWLLESYKFVKDQSIKLHDENNAMKEAASAEIDRLTGLLLAETQEKYNLKEQLEEIIEEKKQDVATHEVFEKIQTLLYVSNLESKIYEHEIVKVFEELDLSKDEVNSLRSNLQRAEEKSSLLREKLSMAVKKGKGLVQERENMKQQMAEKNAQIETLMVDFQKLESTLIDYKDHKDQVAEKNAQIETLTVDFQKLESTLTDYKGQVAEKNAQIETLTVDFQKLESTLTDYKDQVAEKNAQTVDFSKLESTLSDYKGQVAEKNAQIEALTVDFQKLESTLSDYKGQVAEKNAQIEALTVDFQKLESTLSDYKDQIAEKNAQTVDFSKLESTLSEYKDQVAEKNAQIEALTVDFQKQESTLSDYKDQVAEKNAQIEALTVDFSKLESTSSDYKDQVAKLDSERNQIGQFLAQSNTMLQNIVEIIDGIDITFPLELKEPVEKLKWLTTYLNECQVAKDEAGQLASKLTEVLVNIKSLEDALSVSEKNVYQLSEMKREVEDSKVQAEQEVDTLNNKLVETLKTVKSLEDKLAGSEKTIGLLTEEKNELESAKCHAEEELQKVKEEVSFHASNLGDAKKTIKSLEEAISQLNTNVSQFSQENEKAVDNRTVLEREINKLKEEAEVEISTLKAELSTCRHELAVVNDKWGPQLLGFLGKFQVLLKDESLFLLFKQSFETKIESLKEIDQVLKDVKDSFDQEQLQDHPAIEENLQSLTFFPDGLNYDWTAEMVDDDFNAEDTEGIGAYVGKTFDNLNTKNQILAKQFGNFSTLVDDIIASLLKKLEAIRNTIPLMVQQATSLRQESENMKMEKEMQDNKVVALENTIKVLLSACTDVTKDLNMLQVDPTIELEKVVDDVAVADVKVAADELESAARNVKTIMENMSSMIESLQTELKKTSSMYDKSKEVIEETTSMYDKSKGVIEELEAKLEKTGSMYDKSKGVIEELQGELEKTGSMYEKVKDENAAFQKRVFELETELEASRESCNEMSSRLEDYRAKEDKGNERERELSVRSISSVKDYEDDAEKALLSASQIKTLFEKIEDITIPFPSLTVGNKQAQDLNPEEKLFYIIDSVNDLLDQLTLLTHTKEDLRSTLSKQTLEVDHLKSEFRDGLQNIIQKLGGDESIGVKKPADVAGLLLVLERLVHGIILDGQSSRSKLVETQKVAEELSNKVKLMEDFIQNRTSGPDMIQERGVVGSPSFSPGSEISEIDDQVTVGKAGLPLVPSSAQMRPLKKGSNEQLAITIDSESDRLLNKAETDEDKGHIFKSLHTTGLVPVQGKMIADRIDGIWVSGGQALMRRPRARLGLIAYWLVLHLWLLGTIL